MVEEDNGVERTEKSLAAPRVALWRGSVEAAEIRAAEGVREEGRRGW